MTLLTCLLLLFSSSTSGSNYFPAPVAAPQLLLYYDFARTDFYNPESDSLPAIAQIIGHTYKDRLSSDLTGTDLNEKIAQYLRNKPDLNNLKVDKLFFYLKDNENFAVVLSGSFDRERIKSLYHQRFVTTTDSGAIIDLKIDSMALPDLRLFVNDEYLMLAAATTIEAFIENLIQSKTILSGRYQTFVGMVNANPMLAAELSVAGVKQRLIDDSIRLPDWLQALRHVRLIVDGRLTRMQLVVNSEVEITKVKSMINEQLSSFDMGQNLSVNRQNSSIFIETDASLELEKAVAQHTAAFILHFFVKADLESSKLTSENEHAAR